MGTNPQPEGLTRVSTHPIPTIPTQVYRGDRYRLNYTAGTVLMLLADYGGVTAEAIHTVLLTQNDALGIPGGPAGTQWTPPGIKVDHKFDKNKPKKPLVDKDDVELDTPPIPNLDDPLDMPDVEYHEDTLREHCTAFERNAARLVEILKLLDYCRLVDYTGTDVDITDLGKAVANDMRQAETNLRTVGAAHGTMTPTQNYFVGDSRDHKATAHTIPFTALPFSITDAVHAAAQLYTDDSDHDAQFAALGSNYYSYAVKMGIEHPELTVDPGTDDITEEDGSLPIRRNLQREPSYRQFLWLLHNNRNVFVLAYVGVTEESTHLVGSKSQLGSAAAIAANPLWAKIKEARTIVKKTQKFAAMVLTGGPEAVWAGKPIRAKDVHADVTAFVAAARPGFDNAIAQGSSLAWETYNKLHLTISDLEIARSALYEGYGRGLVVENIVTQGGGISAETSIADALDQIDGPNADRKLTITSAEKFVQRTADKVLKDIGLDIEVHPVMTPGGVPMDVMCRHTTAFTTNDGKTRSQHRCNGHSIGGSGYCEKHGGTYLSPEETESLVRASQQKIFAGASKAAEVMLEIMLTSTNDAVKLRAAEQILNRAGLSENRDLTVKIDNSDEHEETPGQIVRSRIMALARITPAEEKAIEESRNNGTTNAYGEQETIDAEIVEDDPTRRNT